VGPRAGLDIMKKRENPCPCRESNDDSSAFQLIAQSLYRVRWLPFYDAKELLSSLNVAPNRNDFLTDNFTNI
jgi:hypothetical protein